MMNSHDRRLRRVDSKLKETTEILGQIVQKSEIVLFHGTGARRRQSIKRRGLIPLPDSYVHASPIREVALVFAAARGELEDDWGLLVQFLGQGKAWEIDPLFPGSLRTVQSISKKDIVSLEIVDPQEELKVYAWLKELVKTIFLAV